jgi:phosphoribosylformimino-5-aminoimidazole carboxamide ribotide isomerase
VKIIAAMDIIGGRCVRLCRGEFSTRREYSASPLDMAKEFEYAGIKYLHIVDLDGARTGKPVNMDILSLIADRTSLVIDYGGGLRKREDVRMALSNGATQVTAGSIAAMDPVSVISWLREYGPEKIILGADSRERLISTSGWIQGTSLDVIQFISGYAGEGLTDVICTDIARDGMLAGPALDLYREIIDLTGVRLIASGGIRSLEDLDELSVVGCHGAIIGKAIYEGKIKPEELRHYAEKENNTLS